MILFLMFLAALNFFNRFYICVFAAVLFFCMSPNKKLRLNSSVLMLLILAMSVLIFNPISQDAILDMIKPFSFMLCYVVGFSMFGTKADEAYDLRKEETRVTSVFYVWAGGAMLHFLLNMFTNWDSVKRSEMIDFWTKSEMAATGQATLACLTIAVAVAFLFTTVTKWKKIVAIAALVVIFYYNLILAGRTLFVFLIIAALAAITYSSIVDKKKISKILIVILVLALLLIWLYNTDAFNIRTEFESSNFYMRFYGGEVTQEIDDDTRLAHKAAYLERFFDHPWGGNHIKADYGHHAHDLYLDTYDESGIFALIAVIAYIVVSISRAIRFIRNKKFTEQTRMLVFCTYLICNIQFWMEPIMSGIPWLFAAYCFIDGAVSYLLLKGENVRGAAVLRKETEYTDL